jgi:hypothetical protein
VCFGYPPLQIVWLPLMRLIIISQAMSQTSVCGARPFGGGSHVLLSM